MNHEIKYNILELIRLSKLMNREIAHNLLIFTLHKKSYPTILHDLITCAGYHPYFNGIIANMIRTRKCTLNETDMRWLSLYVGLWQFS